MESLIHKNIKKGDTFITYDGDIIEFYQYDHYTEIYKFKLINDEKEKRFIYSYHLCFLTPMDLSEETIGELKIVWWQRTDFKYENKHNKDIISRFPTMKHKLDLL